MTRKATVNNNQIVVPREKASTDNLICVFLC